VLILLVEKWSSTVNLIERIMKDLHASFHCEYQTVKKLSGLSGDQKRKWVGLGALGFSLGLHCLIGEQSAENCEVSLNFSVFI
jgi:hypothetical protein